MNANEVIANRALELMGHRKGEYKFCSPTTRELLAVHERRLPDLASRRMALGNVELVAAMRELIAAFRARARSSPPS